MPIPVQAGEGGAFTVEVDGTAHEVQLPDGWVAPTDVREKYIPKETFQSELDRRVKSVTAGLAKPEELLQDNSFVDRMVEARGEELRKRLGVKPVDPPDLERITQQAEERVGKPLKEQLKETEGTINGLKETIGKLQTRALEADVAEAANALGLEEENLDLVRLWVREHAVWDDEFQAWFAAGPEGKPDYAGKIETGKAPYKTIRELLQDVHRSGTRKSWFKARVREGAGYQGGGGGRGVVTLDQFEKMPASERTALHKQDRETWQRLMGEKRAKGESALYGAT